MAELSELLRDVISRDAPDMVRLRDELAFVRRYLDIEAVRFADRLRVEWDVEPRCRRRGRSVARRAAAGGERDASRRLRVVELPGDCGSPRAATERARRST